MSEAAAWMEAAEAVARVAGEVALRHYHRGVIVETKGDGTPVSVADREAEEAARRWLEQRFPADGILGEELGSTRPEARRRWILDPIDGTKTFVRRVPLWGTLVALAEGESVLAGAFFRGGGAGGRRGSAGCRERTPGPGVDGRRAGVGGGALQRRATGHARTATGLRRARCTGGPRADLGRLLRLSAGGHRTGRGDGRRADGPLGRRRAPAHHRGGRGSLHRLGRPVDGVWRHTVATNAALAAGRGRCSLRPATQGVLQDGGTHPIAPVIRSSGWLRPGHVPGTCWPKHP